MGAGEFDDGGSLVIYSIPLGNKGVENLLLLTLYYGNGRYVHVYPLTDH